MRIGDNYAFTHVADVEYNAEKESATVEGVGAKTLVLILITLVTAMFLIGTVLRTGYLPIITYVIAALGIMILQIIMIFKPLSAKKLAIPYAIAEGLTIGCACSLLELLWPNVGLRISSLALIITLCIFGGSLFLYSKKIINPGEKFRSALFSFSLGFCIFILLFTLVSLITSLTTGFSLLAYFYFDGLGVVISLIMCIFAVLYVVATISSVDDMIQAGIDKDYEWYGAYAILLNVVYLFLEVLRLLIIIASKVKKD